MLSTEIARHGLKAIREARTPNGHQKECVDALRDKGGLSISRVLWGYWEQKDRSMKLRQLWAIKKAFDLKWIDTISLFVWFVSDTPPPPVKSRRSSPDEDQDPESNAESSLESDPAGSC